MIPGSPPAETTLGSWAWRAPSACRVKPHALDPCPRGNVLPLFGASGPGRPGGSERGVVMAWVYLFVAGLLEVVWAVLMKQSLGFTRFWPTVGTIVFMIGSFGLLSVSMRTLPLGTAYVIWTGIGAVGTFVVGIAVLSEALTPARVLAATLIVGGLILMKASSPQ